MKIAFYGSSIVSAYWNGAATYYRGLLRALARRGYEITFFEPDVYDRQKHCDIGSPDWCTVVVYEGSLPALKHVTTLASQADIVVKASGVGFEDDLLLAEVMAAARPDALKIFWDVDAPATLAELSATPDHPLRGSLPDLDLVLTYGGGDPVANAYRALGARDCIPIYNALDPKTHFPTEPDPRFEADLGFLGNRLPDREARVERFFLEPAGLMSDRTFLLGGSAGRTSRNPTMSATRATCLPRTTMPSTSRRHHPQHISRGHGAYRLLARDSRVRGGWRGSLRHHRCVGRHRPLPEADEEIL